MSSRNGSSAAWFTPVADGVSDGQGAVFDPVTHRWRRAGLGDLASTGPRWSAAEAVRHLIGLGGRRLPVGVIGPNEAGAQELRIAEQVGEAIARLGLPMICGGRGGCMEAASCGHARQGGLVIALLPSGDPFSGNAHVGVPIATGIGEARNALIASACFALVAVGGGLGTLSEMALGLKLGRRVVAMPPALPVPQALRCDTIDEAIDAVARRYLELGDRPESPGAAA
jgi:hypothetical protein